jgi:catechol 2,3-dioxygenase-like lactoylglutathione lyase family enzyme
MALVDTISGYTHVNILVTDLDASHDFYIDKLGFSAHPRPGFRGLRGRLVPHREPPCPSQRRRGDARSQRWFSVSRLPRAGGALRRDRRRPHNHAITLHGDTATGLSYLDARTITNGESCHVAARFDDEYVREAEGWRFRSLRRTLYFAVPLRDGWAGENRIRLS